MSSREALVQTYRWLRQHGLNDSHSGNASVREGDHFWITPTGACADSLQPDELVRCPVDGEIPAGASLDAPLHQAVYRRVADAATVLHSHGPHAIAMTFDGRDFVPDDFEGRYYFERIPVLDIAFDDYVSESPQRVAASLARIPVCVVRGHGVYVCAPDLDLAYKRTCSFESSARLSLLGRVAGTLPAR